METALDDQLSTANCWRRTAFRLGEDVVVEPLRLEIRIGARVTRLEPRLMIVLTALAGHGESVATREDLLAAAWNDEAADEALTLAISRLRRALGPHAELIATVPKVGYRLTTPPAPICERRPETTGRAKPNHRLVRLSALAAMVLLSFWLGAYGAVWAQRYDFAGTQAAND